MPDPKKPGGRIPQHPLVEALVPDPTQPPRKSAQLFGYPGKAATPRSTRLWLDLELTSYVDVPDEAILYTKVLDDDAGTVLWVDASAKLTYSTVQSQEVQADFLTGSIASAHLGAAAGQTVAQAAGAGAQLRPSFYGPCHTQFGPCITVGPPCGGTTLIPYCPTALPHLCRSVLQPCISHGACPSVVTICKSHLIPCQSIPIYACPITTLALCPSRICPSETIPCISDVGCPTFGPCPSIACGGGFGGGGGGPVA